MKKYTPLKIMLEKTYQEKIVHLFLGIITVEVLAFVLFKYWSQIKIPLDNYITLILQLLKYGN